MVVDYDVVIAGAGPAGAECARYLAKNSKYRVLLLDKTNEIGEPKKSTAGTFSETIRTFKIPKKVVMCKLNKAVFESQNERAVFPINACVMDFAKFKKFLVEDAVNYGATVGIEANITLPVVEGKRVVGVEYRDHDGVHVIRSKIVIDATGPSAVLASKLGLRNPKYHWGGMEFEMEKLKLKQQNAMVLRFDNRFAPGGYSWIFSTGKNKGKVGVCWADSLFKKRKENGSQVSYLKKWIKSDSRLKNGVCLEMHAGDAYYDFVNRFSSDNFMAIGDVICAINPFAGEGIRPSMYSGMFAAQTAIKALKKNDFSARFLSEYDAKWSLYSRNWNFARLFSRFVYSLSNEGFDRLIKNVSSLDYAAFKRIRDFNPRLLDLWKLLPL
ncbi:NAD(P)/FAD-dependent oxidoreductase [Candidatus Woesearchaeota archaeon]|nr:NAD(P)/FAD-dependent oxidoreductase [Candidatus Woesearchaeota archaeon]